MTNMELSVMRKEKEFEYIAMKKKALAFEQLLKKKKKKRNRARPGIKSGFKWSYIDAGKDSYISTGER